MVRHRRWLALAPVCVIACVPAVPELDYDVSTGDGPTSSASAMTMDPAASGTISTTTMTTTVDTDPDTDTDTTTDSSSTSSSDSSSSSSDTGTPEDFGPCSPVADALEHMSNASGHTVANDQIAIELATASNGMLVSLRAGDAAGELIHTDPAPNERLTGIGYFVAADEDEYSWRGTTPTIAVLETGPAVVRVSVGWNANDASTTAALVGTTVYTVIPDGRLVREESVALTHPGGAPAPMVWLTMYAALRADLFDRVRGNFDPNCFEKIAPGECPVGADPVIGTYILGYGPGSADGWICGLNTLTGLSVSWITESEAQIGDPTGSPRISEYRTKAGDHTFALQYDWFRDFTPTDATFGMSAQMFVDIDDDADPCTCSEEHFNSYATPATFDPMNASLVEFRATGGYYDVGVSGDPVSLTLEAGLPPTLLLRLEGPTDVTSVELDDDVLVDGTDYLTQAGMDEESAWLYLARPLAIGQTLVIEANP